MSNLTQLRLAAREIFNEVLHAVDAGAAVRRRVRLHDSRLEVCDTTTDIGNRPVYSIAMGKAAFNMASALEELLSERLTDGIISGNEPRFNRANGETPQFSNLRHTVFLGGHPKPNEQSLAAARACFDLLDRANREHAVVIFLISGGGSAMIECPINADITLSELRAANKALVNSGASIAEINAVRRAFSSVKGGRLAARAPDCDQVTLIVSDVPAGEERNVASGPSLAPSDDAPDARAIIARYNLASLLPESILRATASPTGPVAVESESLRQHFVLLDNQSALDAAAQAAQRLGYQTEIAWEISDQPIETGCSQLLDKLAELQAGRAANETTTVCLISGGEFGCPVRGEGIGGRSLETALRLASSTNLRWSDNQHFVAICAGTDGIDGNSPAAGAIVDSSTRIRAESIGLDPRDFLARSDAYSFFVALGDAITTGPTGTNVRDLRILLG
jgi:glycerate 2-kinase